MCRTPGGVERGRLAPYFYLSPPRRLARHFYIPFPRMLALHFYFPSFTLAGTVLALSLPLLPTLPHAGGSEGGLLVDCVMLGLLGGVTMLQKVGRHPLSSEEGMT